MNKLATKATFIDGLAEEVAELKGNGFGPLLKYDYAKEKYFVGEDEVPLGREFIAHCDQYARGWTKFVDKVPVDVRVFKIGNGKPPERHELDELQLADTENDLWVFQRFLPLEDLETGEIIVFVSKSVGGKIALGDLLSTFGANAHRGLPMVKLATGSFNTKSFGKKPRPVFVIMGYSGGDTKKTLMSLNEPGPPNYEPGDPGPTFESVDF
ncbi:MAG TPA: hypothetical protein VH934_07530 [Xanthobacteraceae bacterium]